MLIFFSPCGLCSRSLCTSISMRRRKMYFLVYKKNRSIWGPCKFLTLSPNTLWNVSYLSICLETWKNLYGRNLEKWRICMEMWRSFKEKWKTIWKNAEFDWKSERIYMAKIWKWKKCMETWRIYKEKWRIYGKMTNSSGQAKEFIWSNGILSIGFLASTVF